MKIQIQIQLEIILYKIYVNSLNTKIEKKGANKKKNYFDFPECLSKVGDKSMFEKGGIVNKSHKKSVKSASKLTKKDIGWNTLSLVGDKSMFEKGGL